MVALQAALALVVIAAAMWLVLGPLWRGRAAEPEVYDPPDPSETKKGVALAALREIEFDRATGKLSDEDYQALHQKYQAEALAILRAESTGPEADAEALIETQARLLVEPGTGPRPACPRCGPRPEPDALYCSACGDRIPTADQCTECGARLPSGGKFCGSCGRRVAA